MQAVDQGVLKLAHEHTYMRPFQFSGGMKRERKEGGGVSARLCPWQAGIRTSSAASDKRDECACKVFEIRVLVEVVLITLADSSEKVHSRDRIDKESDACSRSEYHCEKAPNDKSVAAQTHRQPEEC